MIYLLLLRNSQEKKLKNGLNALTQPLISVLLALLMGAVVIALSGESVVKAYGVMLKGAFGDGYYLSSTLSRATPIIMGGLAVCIAWRSGYEAMGGEGQPGGAGRGGYFTTMSIM